MSTRPAIQVKYNPQTFTLPPSVPENFPGAKSRPGRGYWPNPPNSTGAAPVDLVRCGFLLGDFLFLEATVELEGVILSPQNYAVARLSTGKLDTTTFYPKPNKTVRTMAFDGRFLYFGGDFTEVDGVNRIDGRVIAGVCRFDFQLGGALDVNWNPEPTFGLQKSVERLEVNPDKGTIYIAGGTMSALRGTTRIEIGEVETAVGNTAVVTSWNPQPNGVVVNVKYDAAIQNVYLAGFFTSIQGDGAHSRLVRMDTVGAGAVDATWLPDPNATTRVIFLDGSRVFVGGDFTSIGATPSVRNGAAEIDNVGEETAWNPNVTGGSVFAMAKVKETTTKIGGSFTDYIVMGGNFTTIGGTGRAAVGAVDITTAALHDWDPNPGAPSGSGILITDLRVRDRTVFVFGNYEGIGIDPSPRKDITAVPFPLFNDTNAKFAALSGDDAGAGTRTDPFRTINKALGSLGGAALYGVPLGSDEYKENLDGTIPVGLSLLSDPGQTPTLSGKPGTIAGTFGARPTGRTKFSTGAFPATFVFLSKAGNDGTGTRGDQSKPFLNFGPAKAALLDSDTLQVEDSGVYDTGSQVFGFATEITIQAAAGATPTFRFQEPFPGGGVHFNANNGVGQTFNVYGISFQDGPDDEFPSVTAIRSEGPLNVFDCTFREGVTSLNTLGPSCVVENCLFSNVPGQCIEIVGTATVRNCQFENCGGLTGGPAPATIHATIASKDVVITGCGFENPGLAAGALWDTIQIERSAATPNPSADMVSFCDFFFTNTTTIKDVRGVHIKRVASSPAAGVSDTVNDCQFADLGRQAVYFNTPFNGGWTLRGSRCVAYRCQGLATVDEGTYQFEKPNAAIFSSYVSIASGLHGFQIVKGDLTPQGTRFDNCVSLKSAGDGFRVDSLGIAPPLSTFQGCIEDDSVGDGFKIANDTQVGKEIIIYSSFKRPIVSTNSVLILTGTFQNNDPKFINKSAGTENLAVFADSTTLFNGDSLNSKNMGFFGAVVTLSNGEETIEGFIINSVRNKDNGINVDDGIVDVGDIVNCTFIGLGGYGILLDSGYKVNNCLFQNSGTGIVMGASDGNLTQSVGDGCGSAFIIAGGTNLVIKNNTAYLCDFGQFDRPGAFFSELKNNIYSSNGSLDYSGDGTISNSVVGTLSSGATLANGSRLNPLFIDTGDRNLNIQKTENGFFFDSPAKNLGDDGKDAGAFTFTLFPTLKIFTLVDFETDLGGPGKIYRNPTYLIRKSSALKLREGETHGGVTYSEASAFKRERVLTWEANTDMPPEQVADLEAIYTTGDGECQISIDGGVIFIPVRVIRSAGFEFTELADAQFSDDSLPTPVSELVFRDSL